MSTGRSITRVDYEGLAVLIKACNKNNVSTLKLGDGTDVVFTSPCGSHKPVKVRDLPSSEQVSLFDGALDTEPERGIIDDEGDTTVLTDVVENLEEELDTLMVSDPSSYEDLIIGELTNEANQER